MSDSQNRGDALYIGGPNDGVRFTSDDAAVVDVPDDGLVHRYIRTTAHRDGDDGPLVYNYDGVVDPSGATPGVERHRTT
jgi:hypothetical protein